MTIFVSNIDYKITEQQLKTAFEDFGVVNSCKIVFDKETRKPKGFGFIEMDDYDAAKAVKGMDGIQIGTRAIKVKVSEPKA